MIQVMRMVTVSVIIPVEPNFCFNRKDKFSCDLTMHTSSMCIIGLELSSRIGSEEIAIHCSCSAVIVAMTLYNTFVFTVNARMNKAACSSNHVSWS